jgi:protein-tyrosine kinase
MSRIHEALKRAEREKGRALGPSVEAADEPHAAVQASTAAPAVQQSEIAAPAPPAPVASLAGVAAAAAPTLVLDAPTAANSPTQPGSFRRTHWNEDVSKLLFLGGSGHAFAAEQLRLLRSRLYQFRELRPLKSVLVTSAMPGEGKTFICANLAYAFARQTDRRILLVDADLRTPALHTLMGAPADPGLGSYLRGEARLDQIVQRGPHESLFLIPAGRPAHSPADLIAGGKLKGLLSQAAPLFDWILVDSPAAAPVSDALHIADWCDGVLLVVRSGATPYDLAQGVTREFREKRLLGVVLNRTEPPAN